MLELIKEHWKGAGKAIGSLITILGSAYFILQLFDVVVSLQDLRFLFIFVVVIIILGPLYLTIRDISKKTWSGFIDGLRDIKSIKDLKTQLAQLKINIEDVNKNLESLNVQSIKKDTENLKIELKKLQGLIGEPDETNGLRRFRRRPNIFRTILGLRSKGKTIFERIEELEETDRKV